MNKITTDDILSNLQKYKFEIIFLIIILIIASLAKTLFNFILDYRVLIVLLILLWYLGYLKSFQNSITTKLKKLTYFTAFR